MSDCPFPTKKLPNGACMLPAELSLSGKQISCGPNKKTQVVKHPNGKYSLKCLPLDGPPPDPEPEPGEQLPPKDHNYFLSCGWYTGVSAQLDFDWSRAFDLLYPSPFNWTSFHDNTSWDNPKSEYFLEFDGKVYKCSKPNMQKWAHFEEMLYQAQRHDIGVVDVSEDQYNDVKWLTSAWKTSPYHVYRNNDAKVKWTTEIPLYMNWNHQNAKDPKNFAYIFFKTDDKDNVLEYRPTNALGEAILERYDIKFSIVAKMLKKYPRLKYRFCAANECLLYTENNQWVPGGRDFDGRTIQIFKKIAAKHGLSFGPKGIQEHISVNFIEKIPDRHLSIPRHKQHENAVRPAFTEIHGFEDKNEIPSELSIKVNVISSDGANENDYYNKMKTFRTLIDMDGDPTKEPSIMFDAKMVPKDRWNSNKMMPNVESAIEPMSLAFGKKIDVVQEKQLDSFMGMQSRSDVLDSPGQLRHQAHDLEKRIPQNAIMWREN